MTSHIKDRDFYSFCLKHNEKSCHKSESISDDKIYNEFSKNLSQSAFIKLIFIIIIIYIIFSDSYCTELPKYSMQ